MPALNQQASPSVPCVSAPLAYNPPQCRFYPAAFVRPSSYDHLHRTILHSPQCGPPPAPQTKLDCIQIPFQSRKRRRSLAELYFAYQRKALVVHAVWIFLKIFLASTALTGLLTDVAVSDWSWFTFLEPFFSACNHSSIHFLVFSYF